MKEKEFITIIKNTLNSPYIGDDCAYLKDLGVVVTQDSLVEDIHFSTKFISAFDLGFKAVMVNVSDVAASGAEPKYLTVSLSLPSNVKEDFVEEFYNGCKKLVVMMSRLLVGILQALTKYTFQFLQLEKL